MDLNTYLQIYHDKSFFHYDKMRHKYGKNFDEFLAAIKEYEYKTLPLADFNGANAVLLKNRASLREETVRLLSFKNSRDPYGFQAAEDEIAASNAIENIHFSRDSIRSILKGFSPKDDMENRILGQKKGLEFIADKSNAITEENLHKLYQMMVGDFLPAEDRLLEGAYYRHDTVFVVGDKVEHAGLNHHQLNVYMQQFTAFIHQESELSDLEKASVIHFYLVHLHPYFDGNGRMARMVHLWYLIQRGYTAALFVPFSSLIQKSRKEYYKAISQVESNQSVSGLLDITPFVHYFSEYVYKMIPENISVRNSFAVYEQAVKDGVITEKETLLWAFVLSRYGDNEFSTKQLEKDFGDAAYATIRSFVLKFEGLELFSSRKLGNRVKYRVTTGE